MFSNKLNKCGAIACLAFATFLQAAPVLTDLDGLSSNVLEERICCELPEPILPKPKPTSTISAASGPPTASTALTAGGYWSEIQAETAGVTFNMLYDTGSPRFIICGVAGPNNPKNIYPLTDAQKNNGKKFSISYDDGTTDSGVEVEDTVIIAGLHVPMTLSVSTTCQLNLGIDGILGTRLDGDTDTFNQAAAKILKEPTFAMSMSFGYSEIVFGEDPDSLDYINDIKTVKADNNWMVQGVSFPVKGGTKSGTLQMDTGTSMTELDGAIVDAYHGQISNATRGNAGNWSIPCDATNLPDFTFTEPNNSGYTHIIPGAAFIGNAGDNNMCTSMMAPTSSQWFPGWAFWSTHYTWFDTSNQNVQFAQDVSDSSALQTSVKEVLQVKEHNQPPPSISNE